MWVSWRSLPWYRIDGNLRVFRLHTCPAQSSRRNFDWHNHHRRESHRLLQVSLCPAILSDLSTWHDANHALECVEAIEGPSSELSTSILRCQYSTARRFSCHGRGLPRWSSGDVSCSQQSSAQVVVSVTTTAFRNGYFQMHGPRTWPTR